MQKARQSQEPLTSHDTNDDDKANNGCLAHIEGGIKSNMICVIWNKPID